MATHLIIITETRDFVYEVEAPTGTVEETKENARLAALTIHNGRSVTDMKIASVSCFRARPIKRKAEWIASRKGKI